MANYSLTRKCNFVKSVILFLFFAQNAHNPPNQLTINLFNWLPGVKFRI